MLTTSEIAELVATAVSTLAGAYFGARFAFNFQNRHLREESGHADVKSANMTLLKLMQSHHDLTAYNNQFLAPHVGGHDRHFAVLPATGAFHHLDIDFASLVFLLKGSDANLINALALTQLEINATFDTINERSRFHWSEMQPLLASIQSQLGETTTLRDLEAQLGTRVTQTLRGLTDTLVSAVPAAISTLEDSCKSLHKATKGLYPEHAVARLLPPGSRSET